MILRTVALAPVAITLTHQLAAQQLPGASEATKSALRRGEWPAYAGSNGSLRWSPLDVINKSNAAKLEVHNITQPANLGWSNMGVAYWKSGDDERLLILTGDALLVAVDARIGLPVENFGDNGKVRSHPRTSSFFPSPGLH
jgi:glucose dehydrogenase